MRLGDTPPCARLRRLIFAPFSSPAVIVAVVGKSADVLRCIQMRRGRPECFSLRKGPLVQTRRHLSEAKRGETETYYRRASNINPELLLSSCYIFFSSTHSLLVFHRRLQYMSRTSAELAQSCLGGSRIGTGHFVMLK